MLQVIAELIFELILSDAFASGTASEGVPGLDREFQNDTVEG